MRRPGLTLIIVGAVIVGLVVAELATSGSGSAGRRAAPQLPQQALSGQRVTLAGLRGRPAVINFWASWCGPCKKELPELERFYTSPGRRASLVGIDWGDSAANARAFVARYRLTYPILRDGDNGVGNRFGLTGLPTTFVLDSKGRIARTLNGAQTVATLNAALQDVK